MENLNYNPYSNTKVVIRKIILTTQKNKRGECAIYVELLQVDTKKYKRINTNVTVKPDSWSKKKELVLSSDKDFNAKNTAVNLVYSKILKYVSELENQVYRQSVEKEYSNLKGLFPELYKKSKSLTDYFEEYTEFRKSTGASRGTWKEFITVNNRLKEYEKYSKKTLYFNDMNLSFSDSFYAWMINEAKYNSGTIEKTFTVLKTFLGHYYKRRKELNIFLDNTFQDRDFKRGRKSVNEADPLTYKEFLYLFNYEFDNLSLSKTKDRFCLQCSTGLRYSDIDKIRPEMIDNNRIVIDPTKTQETKDDNTIYIDLNKYSTAILERYNYDTASLKISNQKYNESLKAMFEKLSMPVKTSHNGRDTFISICIEKNVPIPIILSWSGQSSYSIMKRYIKLSDTHKKEEMNRVFL